jgi:toxin ParE1/3/4
VARRIVLRPAADRHLDRLYEYISEQAGPTIAIGYIRRIREHCDLLREFPERGVKRDDLRLGLRIVGFERRAAIAFAFDDEKITIARIFYGGRDYEALFRDEE